MLWPHRSREQKQQPCTHAGALPRWDSVEDSGRDDRVVRLYCPRCDRFLPPDRG
ncbi:MAG TPA: hypothetical protein VKV26_22620 [Dehalococcoidia bacterium]|nr:hypothetical protein [Dehalococcoidia bacterium]